MKYLLDTNICIYLMRGKHPAVTARMRQHSEEGLAVSTVTVAELRFGAEKSEEPHRHHALISNLLMPFQILPFDFGAADTYGEIRADLERRGQLIGSLDMLLAAHALSQSLIFVTHNTSEFQRVKGLQFEDWYESG